MQARFSDLEQSISQLNQQIEALKIEFNLFFSGEISIPPEKERGDIEKKIRMLSSIDQKSAKINLLVQNISSKFAIYNNMWLKRLHEIEVGIVPIKKKSGISTVLSQGKKQAPKDLAVSLNDENSFEKFFEDYCSLSKKGAIKSIDKEKIINSLKSKMITANMIDAQVQLTQKQGKVKVRILN